MDYSTSLVLWISRKADKNTWVLHVAGDIIDITMSCDLKLFISPNYLFYRGAGSSVGIATELRVGPSGIESRWGRNFPPVQTGPGAHSASCTMGTGSFLGVEVAGARG